MSQKSIKYSEFIMDGAVQANKPLGYLQSKVLENTNLVSALQINQLEFKRMPIYFQESMISPGRMIINFNPQEESRYNKK